MRTKSDFGDILKRFLHVTTTFVMELYSHPSSFALEVCIYRSEVLKGKVTDAQCTALHTIPVSTKIRQCQHFQPGHANYGPSYFLSVAGPCFVRHRSRVAEAMNYQYASGGSLSLRFLRLACHICGTRRLWFFSLYSSLFSTPVSLCNPILWA